MPAGPPLPKCSRIFLHRLSRPWQQASEGPSVCPSKGTTAHLPQGQAARAPRGRASRCILGNTPRTAPRCSPSLLS